MALIAGLAALPTLACQLRRLVRTEEVAVA
jgi:hypothetical protein